MLGPEAVCRRANSVALACGNQLAEVLLMVCHFCISLVADVWICLCTRCFRQVATIRHKSRIGGGDHRVNECNSLLAVLLSCSRVSEQLHIWRTRQPSQAMHVRTATVLPLKPQPVVLCTKDVQVKALEELLESLVEKPVSYSWVVNDCMPAGTCILWTILADQVCQFWPLKVRCTAR